MKKLFYAIPLIALILTQCEKEDTWATFFKFQNNSSKDIILRISTNYPDTLLPEDYIDVYGIFRAGQTSDVVYRQSFIEKKNFADKKILLFAYDYTVFANTPFDSIRLKHLELRRYELTRKWLEEHDWTVTYP